MITGRPVDEGAEHPSVLPLRRNRDYLLLLSGQAVSRSGTQVSQTATPLLVLAITGSPAWAGILFGMVLVPTLLLGLPAGALIDRYERKRIMIVCDLLRALALGSIPVALILGRLTLVQLCVTSLIEGTCSVFFTVAETTSFPQVIDEEQMGVASGQQQAVANVALLVGPALAGIALSIGRVFPFLLDALSYVASVVSLLGIKHRFPAEPAETTSSILEQIRDGVQWLWQDKVIRLFTLLAAIGSGIDNALFLVFVVIATQHLHASVAATGIAIGVAAGGGGILGALLANRLERTFGVARLTITTSWIRVGLLPLLLLAPNIIVLGLVLFVDGLALVSQATALYATRQLLIPQEIRGRISSVYYLATLGSPLLFIWGVGALLQWVGILFTLLLLAVIAACAAILVTLNRDIRRVPRSSDHAKRTMKNEGASE